MSDVKQIKLAFRQAGRHTKFHQARMQSDCMNEKCDKGDKLGRYHVRQVTERMSTS